MKTKQTAVEWLTKEFVKLESTIGVHGIMYELMEQAKAMEKQQIEDAYDKGSLNHHAQYTEQYDNLKQDYIKTYKSE